MREPTLYGQKESTKENKHTMITMSGMGICEKGIPWRGGEEERVVQRRLSKEMITEQSLEI